MKAMRLGTAMRGLAVVASVAIATPMMASDQGKKDAPGAQKTETSRGGYDIGRFGQRARAWGLTSAEAADLQKQVDKVVAETGGTQIGLNAVLSKDGSSTTTIPLPDQNWEGAPTPMEEKVVHIKEVMENRFPDTAAGVTLTSDNRVVVRVKQAGAEQARAELGRRGLGDGVVVTPVAHSRRELVELTHRIAADPERPSSLVVTVPDTAANKVRLELDAADPAAAAEHLVRKYGPNRVTVAEKPTSRPRATYRYNDTAPYYGGNAIWRRRPGQPVGTDCSSGFGTVGRRTGNDYMLTAGHCFSLNTPINTNFESPRTIGRVTNVRLCERCIDAETVSGNYTGRVWGSGRSLGVVGVYKATERNGRRSLVTYSGARTGEHRKQRVINTDACIDFRDGITRCYLSVTSGSVTRGGDSGGPVYQYLPSGPNVYAVGIIIGHGEYFNYYQQIRDVTNYFNVDVMLAGVH